MSFIENFKMALFSIFSHKLRSVLTMLGIIIGVSSVVIIVAIGKGGEHLLKSQISSSENNLQIIYQPNNPTQSPNNITDGNFNNSDINLLKSIPEVEDAVGLSSRVVELEYNKTANESTTVLSVNHNYIKEHNFEFVNGINFTRKNISSGERIAIVNQESVKRLFDSQNPLGEIFWLSGQPIKVIGITKNSKEAFGLDTDIYLPESTYKVVFNENNYNQLTLKVKDADSLKTAGEKAQKLLNQAHNTEDSYQVINFKEISKGIENVTSTMTLIISSIAGISLVVGGVGVMNIMLVSVTERTREIGVRKALGATKQQILTQFLIESVTISIIGGLLGVVIGIGISTIISLVAGWPVLISWSILIIGIIFPMIIGVLFGIIPANKAAKLTPIESLRYE
ncbi:ABC transporter permease [Pontibacillus salipaludis]|uniref:ABC transporter permease YknZ n=1 Tax=Pontibacillus salipaludis TaxID=1697394 RepID=A0ABQ1QIQ0_9BACI|nr:ABC transporter permease [Pontibacillus salipaludis]GGD29086.1 putative ABC transporter permease YknZ [Pontibacillus salipaludis]